jgi:predicted Zn-dependent peptidase
LAEGVAVIKNLCTSRGWLTPQLVQAAKRRAVFNRSVAYTQPVQIVSDVAEDVMMGRAWQKDQVIAALERVTPLEVQAFAAKLFDPAHSLLTVVGPDGLDEGALLKLVR